MIKATENSNREKTNYYIGIFSIFLFLNCIFYRDFSYLSIGENIYITELFIGLSLIGLSISFLNTIKTKNLNTQKIIALWAIFFIWGTSLLLADNNSEIIFKIREYAAIYYSLFFLFTTMLINTEKSSNKALKTIIIAAFISVIYVIARFALGLGNITTTDMVYRYGNYELVGILVLYAYTLCRFLQGSDNKTTNIAIIGLSIFVVNFLITHRSGSLAMVATTLVILFFFGKNKSAFNKAGIFIFLGVAGIAAVMLAAPEFGGKAISRITGVFDSSIYEDPNASWRLKVWMHAISSMSFIEVIFGVGWGYNVPVLNFSGRDYAVDGFIGIHNSIVYYFLHIGATGVIIFLTLVYKIYADAIRAIQRSRTDKSKVILVTLLSSNFGILFFAMFNVVLEGPYMSIVFWTTLGLLFNYTRIQSNARIQLGKTTNFSHE